MPSTALEYKRISFELKEVVSTDDGAWTVAGYASTWGGQPDWYGDVIVRGAFAESLAERSPKFLYEHSEPIGKTLEVREDDHGLFGRWSIVDTTRGTDAYKLAKAGVLDSLSIGYLPTEWEYRDDGVRLLKKIDLFEVSATAIPANENAVITDVKRAEPAAPPADDAPAEPKASPVVDPFTADYFAAARSRLVALGVDISTELPS